MIYVSPVMIYVSFVVEAVMTFIFETHSFFQILTSQKATCTEYLIFSSGVKYSIFVLKRDLHIKYGNFVECEKGIFLLFMYKKLNKCVFELYIPEVKMYFNLISFQKWHREFLTSKILTV